MSDDIYIFHINSDFSPDTEIYDKTFGILVN